MSVSRMKVVVSVLMPKTMKAAMGAAVRVFKWLVVIGSAFFLVFILVDDYGLYSRYPDAWAEYLAVLLVYYLIYLAGFFLWYWVIAGPLLLIYYKIKKRRPVN